MEVMLQNAQDLVVNIINSTLDIGTIYTRIEPSTQYDNHKCFRCGNYSLRMYGDNTGYCHACHMRLSIIDIYKLYERMDFPNAIQTIFSEQFRIDLCQNKQDEIGIRIRRYQNWLDNINYTRLLRYYIHYFKIKRFYENIDEHKSRVSDYLNFNWDNLTPAQIFRLVNSSRDSVTMNELKYFSLTIKYYGLRDDVALFRILKLYCLDYSKSMFNKQLSEAGMSKKTYDRLISGSNIRNLDKYKAIVLNSIDPKKLKDFLYHIDCKNRDINRFKCFIKKRIITN